MIKSKKLKSSILFILIYLYSFFSFAQKTNGDVLYSLILENSSDTEITDPRIKNIKSEIEKIAKDLQYKLVFNQTKSRFEMIKSLNLDDSPMGKTAVFLFGGESIFFTDISNKSYLEQKSFLGKKFLIQKPIAKANWELTNETKTISDYTCYKAIGTRVSSNRNLVKKKTYIYAWYCPEIPSQFGPFEATGLPGLVLEFKAKGYSLKAEKISFNSNPTIEKPTEGEILSQEAFRSMIDNLAKRETEN